MDDISLNSGNIGPIHHPDINISVETVGKLDIFHKTCFQFFMEFSWKLKVDIFTAKYLSLIIRVIGRSENPRGQVIL